jgi:hypothetical protein
MPMMTRLIIGSMGIGFGLGYLIMIRIHAHVNFQSLYIENNYISLVIRIIHCTD